MFEAAEEVKEALFPHLRHLLTKILLNVIYLEKLKRKPLLCLFSIFSEEVLLLSCL